jgi:hypothetical protein
MWVELEDGGVIWSTFWTGERDNEPNGWLHELPGICALTERLLTVVAELD